MEINFEHYNSIKGYTILKEIGQGGYGKAYKAFFYKTKKECVIKEV